MWEIESRGYQRNRDLYTPLASHNTPMQVLMARYNKSMYSHHYSRHYNTTHTESKFKIHYLPSLLSAALLLLIEVNIETFTAN